MTTLRKNIILFSCLAVVAVACWVFFLFLPLQTKLRTEHDALYQERINSEIAKLEEQNFQATQKEFERLQSTSGSYRQYFVSEKNILSFISSLETLAQKTSVTQTLQNLLAPTGGSTESSFQIHVQGTTTNVLRYLNSVESLDTYLTIERLTFNHTETASSAGPIDLTILAKISWL